MPKVTAATLAVTGLLLIALTGCSGGTDAADEGTAEPSATPSASPTVEASESPEATAAPITATPTPTEAPAPSKSDDEQKFVAYTAPFLAEQGYSLTDDEVLGAGLYACDLVAQGGNPETITVVEGSPEYVSEQVAVNAVSMLCPSD